MDYQAGLFTVVIPAYNREKTVRRSIESVLHQEYGEVEIIVVDDGSKDGTKDIVADYTDNPKVSYIYQDNGGAQKARNNGLKHAAGEYILFLDSDDELAPDCLGKMVKRYKDDPDLGSVYCLTGKKSVNGDICLVREDHLEGYIYKEVLEQGYLTSTSFISMRRTIFETVGEWDEGFPASQDDDMCFRIAKCFKIGLIKEILGYYWMDAGLNKKIGGSPVRVANGWWILWNKFERDTARMCGNQTIAAHYCDCARRFAYINDKKKLQECIQKISYFGGENMSAFLWAKYNAMRVAYIIRRKIKQCIVR